MTGYEGSHQDWLEGQASDRLEREAFMREQRLYQFEGWHDDKLQIGIPGIGAVRLTAEQAVRFAHAILAEVEIAQRLTDGEFETQPHVDDCNCTRSVADERCIEHRRTLDG